jgi:outer membrane protein
MLRPFFLLLTLVVASPSLAGGLAYVDFQRAVNETTSGQNAQKKLEQTYAAKRGQIEQQKQALQQSLVNYEQRKLILNDEARRAAEQDIMAKQQKLEADVVRYEQEMQEQYMELVSELDTKMRAMAGTIAKERGYDMVLDKAAVVYASAASVDMTDELIRRYNAK